MTNFTAVTIEIDEDLQDALIEDLQNSPRKFRKLYRTRINALAQNTLRKLKAPAPKVRYPIQWKSEKQRRAFFATNGFGAGVPTRRTNKLQDGWQVIEESDFREGLFTIFNSATTRDYFTGAIVYYEQYVSGTSQQPFHRNTGWNRSQDILADAMVDAEDLIIEVWNTINEAK